MNRAFIRFSLLMFACCIMVEPAFAASGSVAHVVWTKGSFSASGRPLVRNSPIFEHDVLATTLGSQAEIVFTDNTLMTFKEGTQFSVDSYHFKTGQQESFVGTMAKGGFRTITGAIAKNDPNHYQINTPVATIGVRGTDYQTVYSGGYLYTVAYSGTVCITPYGSPSSPVCPLGLCNAVRNMRVPC